MEEQIKCEIIKSQITLLDRFYRVIGDGYNPASVSVKYSLNSKIEPESVFIYKSVNNIGEPWYYEQRIKPTKEIVLNPNERLKELMEWNRMHVIGFEQILKADFRLAELREIYQVVYEKIEELISEWNFESSQFVIDSKDGTYRKFLFVSDINKSIVLEFGNYMH